MARLSPRDARAWHRLAERIASAVEPRLGPQVLANRTADAGRPLRASLARARRAAAALALGSDAVIRTDVRAFYASVTPSVLWRALVRCGVEPPAASRAAAMLEGWGSEGYPGLPIGPPGSAVLANAVLAHVDERLAGKPFLRWVDDYLIAAGRGEVPFVLEKLDAALGAHSLERSPLKTEVLEGGRSFRWLGTSAAS